MIAAIAAAIASRTGLSRAALLAILIVALLALAAIGVWRAVAAFDAALEAAAAGARAERDAHWEKEIAMANALAAERQAEQMRAALAADAALRLRAAQLETDLKSLEERNAALAGGDLCGLDRDRVRLLNAPR